MENLNPPPLNLVFSTRAASQEITVPSDATKKTFTIHSYRDTVVNGKVSKSDIIDFTTSITYDPPFFFEFLIFFSRGIFMQYN